MSITDTNKNGWILQELFFMLGYFVHSNLMRQIDYLRVENKIIDLSGNFKSMLQS